MAEQTDRLLRWVILPTYHKASKGWTPEITWKTDTRAMFSPLSHAKPPTVVFTKHSEEDCRPMRKLN